MKKEEKSAGERRCIVTRETRPKEELIRFALSPDGIVIPDLKARLPGRGVWVTASKDLVREAAKTGAFNRGFQTRLTRPDGIEEQLDHLLEAAALGRLKLANKAGELVLGFTKLMAALEKGSIIALIHASEASPDESGKLDHRLRTNLEQTGHLSANGLKKPFNCFKTQQLSLAFGAHNVIHCGIKTGGAGIAACKAIEKLIHYRGQPDETSSASPQ